ncbi:MULTISPECIES: DUF4129 domain-containing protein [unclassified Aureispira]|uniref:DUF4129 domain-containing protein n=1 Tax=unclassified Aureispira TaxID=2649989 RepID=UPI0018CC28EF|nr:MULTISPECIES: DUF4129 domain-containing protein [unclassified Aureispira]WMX14835.1 DUF4129 domain-containing protein [Aureispira sp. CCB-E]
MKKQNLYIGLILWFVVGFSTTFYANDATKAYQNETLTVRTVDKAEWKKTAQGMKYSKKPKAKKTKKKKVTQNTSGTGNVAPPPPREPSNFSFKDFAQTLLVFLAVIILAFVVFKVVAGDAVLVNKEVRRRKPVTLEQIETNLQEADVEGFLKQALADKDYRLAIRLYYLAIIKELAAKGVIEWKKDKTNGHYMRELRNKNHPKLKDFKAVTRIFEYVWYSNTAFDGGQFEEVRINFKNLLASIK